jgi:amino acid transporter
MGEKVIVRKASGLVRVVSKFDALMMCIAAISVGCGQAFLNEVTAASPGVDLVLWLFLGFLICMPHALLYGQIGALTARSGGDYILVSRTLRPDLGFAMSFVFMTGAALVLGGMQPWNATFVVSATLWSVGLATNNEGIINMAKAAVLPESVFIIGTVVLVAILLLMLLPHKAVLRINNAMIILGTLINVVQIGLFLSITREQFINNWNGLLGSQFIRYEDVIPRATAEYGFAMGTGLGPTLSILLLPFWLYFGYHVSNFFSGEMEDVGTNAPISTVGALTFLWVFHSALIYTMIRVTGLEWWTAANTLYLAGEPVAPFSPFTNFISFVCAPSLFSAIFINVLYSLWAFSLWLSYYYFISRPIFAWAFDRVLPVKLAYVSKKTHAPVGALILCFIIAELGLYLSLYTVALVQFNWILTAALMMSIAAFTCIVFPFIKKEQFDAAPRFARLKVGGVPLLSILGAITLAIFIWVISTFITSPAAYGYVTPESVGMIVGTFILGLIIFHVSRWYRRKYEGIDIMDLYKELPPA